jgi:DNA replication protein DnaC
VDHECTQRRENRIRRNLHAAAFPLSASLEELDLSPARGLERRTILELGQCNWIPARQNIIVLGPTGSGKSYLASAFGKAAVRNGFTVRYHRTSRLLHTLSQVRSDVPSRPPCVRWPDVVCSFWMIGCGMPFPSRMRKISWKSSMTALATPPP